MIFYKPTGNFNGRLLLMLAILPFFISCRSLKTFQPSSIVVSGEERISDLPHELHETSGLEIFRDSLISFNDSGGEPSLYIFSPLAPLSAREKRIAGVKNIDWEDIARGSEHFYIGDFGNNNGSRDTMVIYRFPINQLDSKELRPELISFTFKEKLAVHKNKPRNPFDCEAMTIINDSVWLFTKNWRDKTSWIYKFAVTPAHYDLAAYDILEPGMLVTGADYIPEKKLLFLIGYKNFTPRIMAYSFNGNSFEPIFLLRLGNLFGVQTEGIVIKDNIIYFSNEKSLAPQGLYRIYYEEKSSLSNSN